MNLMQLKYFLSICEFGSVSAAADYLHIAQPSLSLAIKELENEFGTLLFHRKHKGMYLTAEGELLRGMAKDIIDRTETTEKIMKDVGHNKKILKLGVPPMIGALILPALYHDFLSKNEDMDLDIVESGKEELVNMILEDQLDVAFISHNKKLDVGLEFLHIDTLEIVCSTALHNPIAQKRVLSPKDLDGVPLVMFKDGFFQSSEIKHWFSADLIEPNILIKTNQLSTMQKIISSDTAVGFLFEKLIRDTDEMTSIHLDPPITADISLIWKKEKFSFSGMQSLKNFLKATKLFS